MTFNQHLVSCEHMSNSITIPTIPSNWIAHSGVIPADNGYRTHVKKVLHTVDYGYHKFVIHQAYESYGEWSYAHGQYFLTESEALAAFENVK